jgi:hypothetical protein
MACPQARHGIGRTLSALGWVPCASCSDQCSCISAACSSTGGPLTAPPPIPWLVQVERASLESPTLIIIGPVVALAPGWQRYQESGESLEGPPQFEEGAAPGGVPLPAELPAAVRELLSKGGRA